MAKKTQSELIIETLLKDGSREVTAKSKKYRQFTYPNDPSKFYFVGKNGAVRVGKNTTDSVSITFMMRHLSQPEKKTPSTTVTISGPFNHLPDHSVKDFYFTESHREDTNPVLLADLKTELQRRGIWEDEPRAYTAEEVRNKVLKVVADYVDYWAGQTTASEREKLEGLAFSTMVILDGGAATLPGFTVTPNADPSDKDFYVAQGENWYPTDVDIAGVLHNNIHRFFKTQG